MKDEIRVLLVAPYGGVVGGISRWTSHILEYHKTVKSNVLLDLVSTGRSVYIGGSSPVFRLYAAIKDYRGIVKCFLRSIKKSHYDVMHLTSSGSWSLFRDLYMIQIAKNKGIKVVVHFRFGRIPDLAKLGNWEWKYVKKVVSRADKVVVIDEFTNQTLIDAGFSNTVFLPNPVSQNVSTIVEKNKKIQREEGLLLFAGHVIQTKGVCELVEACKRIPNIRLKIVGRVLPNMKEHLQTLAGENSGWMQVVGEEPYEDVIKDMLKCELFVLPTYTEGFPNVIIESMACGCAIITTPVGAIPAMLEPCGMAPSGVCVPVKNVESLYESIVYYLEHKKEAQEMGVRAKERVNTEYSIESVWRNMLDIWSDTLC